MNKLENIKKEWSYAVEEFKHSPGYQKILWGNVTANHYVELLKQIYFIYRDIPKLNALALVYFHGSQRKLTGDFLKYAMNQEQQNHLITDDLYKLGINLDRLKIQNPTPSTLALTAFSFYQIQQNSPVSYLGIFLSNEWLFQNIGKELMMTFEKKGVSRQVMSFICEKVIVDHPDESLFQKWAQQLILTNEDSNQVLYAAKSAAYLFGELINHSLSTTDLNQDWGKATAELDSSDEQQYMARQDQYFM